MDKFIILQALMLKLEASKKLLALYASATILLHIGNIMAGNLQK